MDQLIEFVGNHWILSLTWLGLFVMLVLSFTSSSSKIIGNQQVTTMINREKAVVIDIRSKADFNKGHLLGSINIPAGKLKNSDKELESFKDRPIILVDANGMQAAAATMQLKKMGLQKLSRLQGGIVSWTNDNLPLHKS